MNGEIQAHQEQQSKRDARKEEIRAETAISLSGSNPALYESFDLQSGDAAIVVGDDSLEWDSVVVDLVATDEP